VNFQFGSFIMKNIIATTIITSLFLATPALAGTRLKISVPFDGKSEIDILVKPGNTARLVLDEGSLSVIHEDEEIQPIYSDMMKEERLNGQWGLHFDDFNMDGFQDFAVDISYGYGGVNIFSDIYFFNAKTGRFFKGLEEVSNIELSPETGEIHTSQKSGPRYYRTNYRFKDGKPYKYQDVTVIFDNLEVITLYNASGKTIQKAVVDIDSKMRNGRLIPALRAITVERAQLFMKPNEQSRTKAYLIKGDQVEVLEVKGEWDDWYKIRFKGKKTIERWIKPRDIESIEE